ncbi:MAG: DUF4280 domain-containing protein [Alphaproteobacteria bacterium]|jgi:hypothetical protein|nr:DUF4280 domain-containing protein [Alphaproteobacteria bacterium]MBP9776535.1 DUF4280 domain-containing protein [Alphaproteobacteria bacterium]
MSLAVVGGTSLIKCSFGLAPTPLVVLPDRTVIAEEMLMGNIEDKHPLANIETFGMCSSLTNPKVDAATTAAAGVLTPMPCIPNVIAPWVSEALDVTVQGLPAIDETAIVMCLWAGVIHIKKAGNSTVMVP